jgi:hypothetical protein
MTKRTMVTYDIVGTFCVLRECSPDTSLEVVLLQDHCKTPRLCDGQAKLATTSLEVVWVLLAAGGKVKDPDVNL